MRPIFTVHAGEFLVGEHLERNFRHLNIWIPTKDTGIDLLVSGSINKSVSSIQVKMSRDYRPPEASNSFERMLLAAGWLVLNHKKIETSLADIWCFVLVSHERRAKPVFLNVPPKILLKKLVEVHGVKKQYHFYPWVTDKEQCIQGRGLLKADKAKFAQGTIDLGPRDLSEHLDNWSFLEHLQ